LIGMTPFFGLHFVSAVFLAGALKWSRISALVGVNVTNALTAPMIYPINFWVGSRLMGSADSLVWPSDFSFSTWLAFLRQSPLLLMDLVLGGLVLGLPLALIGYWVTRWAVTAVRCRNADTDHRGRTETLSEGSIMSNDLVRNRRPRSK